jgi:DNA-binding NarL/FixJ family response regulator
MIRILLVDDQAVLRDGLKVIFEAQDDLDVVAEAANGAEAVELVRRCSPDVVVMDIRMPHMDGIDATRRIAAAHPESPRILILTTFGEERYVYDALRAGASGFLLKDAQRRELVEAVRVVAGGDRVLSPAITRQVVEQFVQHRPPPSGIPSELDELTPRELEITSLVAQGLSNADIAERLVLSVGTIKSHVAHVLDKLDLRDRVQIVVLAYECGLVQPGERVAPASGD